MPKQRARPRRSTKKKGAGKLTPRRLRAAQRQRELDRMAMDADDVWNQS